MTTLGADPEALERLAELIGRTVVRMGQSERTISRQLGTAGWRGADADRLRGEWRSRGAAALVRMQAVLQECAANLRSQAAAQREASAAHGSAGGGGGGGGGRSWGPDDLYNKVERNSETRTYTAEGVIPGRIVNVKGGGTVTGTVSQDGFGYVATLSGALRPSVTAGLGKGGLGKGGRGSKGGSGGKSRATQARKSEPEAEAGSYAEMEQTRSYRFQSREEAEKFLAGYGKATVPTKREAAKGLVGIVSPALGAGAVGVDAYKDGEAYLKKFENRKESDVVRSSTNGFSKVDFGVGKLDLSNERHVSWGFETNLMDKETTAFAVADLDVGAALGVAGGAKTEVEAGVTVDRHGNPKTLSLSGSLDLHGGLEGAMGLDPSSLKAGTTLQDWPTTAREAGLVTTFDAELDLGDTDNRRDAFAYLQAVAAGDDVGAAKHLAALLDRTAVTIKTSDTVTTGRSIDLVVASAKAETSRTTTRDVVVRMPGGTWKHYPPAS